MYNKLFTKILDSSIWLEPTPTRIVWLTFIAVMDQEGFARFASVANVAHRARVTLEEAQEAVHCLESPDPNSSNPAHGGRRLERVPGGWMVLNADDHRSLVTAAVVREQTRTRVQRHRELKRMCNAAVTPSETETEAEADTEADTEAEQKQEQKQTHIARVTDAPPPMDLWARDLVTLYPAQGRCTWNLVERPLFDALSSDDREPVAAWEALKARLEGHKRSHQWRMKGMIPRLDKWLREGLHLQELPEHAPMAERLTSKTQRTLAAAADIMREPDR